MVEEKDPFQRKNLYRAKEFGTVVVDGKIVPFDVVDSPVASELLGEDTLIGRISGRIIVSDLVPDRRSILSPIEVNLFTPEEKIKSPKPEPTQIDLIKEFVAVEEELARSANLAASTEEDAQTYTGPCI